MNQLDTVLSIRLKSDMAKALKARARKSQLTHQDYLRKALAIIIDNDLVFDVTPRGKLFEGKPQR